MTSVMPVGLEKSVAMQLIISQGWNFSPPNGGQVAVEKCPFCLKDGGKFYVAVEEDPTSNSRDGLWFCHKCQATGNIRTLQEKLGLRIANVHSNKDWSGKSDTPEALPSLEECHARLLGDADALDYLLNVRGFSREIVERQKLGLKEKLYFRKAGETRALVIPYLSNEGNITFAKYRTLPPAEKDFISPHGYEATLYNSPALNDECKEIIMVEGECDALALMSHGVENVVGVPGAGVRKHSWIEAIDRINPKVYVLYDNDKTGAKGAQELASRIGLDRCLKINLPTGVKDINAYFVQGGTTEGFAELKQKAIQFDVTGVSSTTTTLDELESELEGKSELSPKYTSPWTTLNKVVSFEDGDVVDIVAPGKVGKTTLGLNLIDHLTSTYGENGLVICLEMERKRLAKKWISMVTGYEESLAVPGSEEAKTNLVEFKAAIGKARNIQNMRTADLYFAYPQQIKAPEDIYKLMTDCIRRYDIKFIMFDNLQLLCDLIIGSRQGQRTVLLSQISKGLTRIAKDYGRVLIRIVQPKQLEKGATIESRDVDGSSQIEKDCDCQLLMWRKVIGTKTQSAYDEESKEAEESSEVFDSLTRITVALSRYSSGGKCWLTFDGARSQVRSQDIYQRPLKQPDFNGIIPVESGTAIAVRIPTENIQI
jgi:replicative DNA helicase/5S rRNA maturation endonuclease (ribonuclease M5)